MPREGCGVDGIGQQHQERREEDSLSRPEQDFAANAHGGRTLPWALDLAEA